MFLHAPFFLHCKSNASPIIHWTYTGVTLEED